MLSKAATIVFQDCMILSCGPPYSSSQGAETTTMESVNGVELACLRLRGLPFNTTDAELLNFFGSSYSIVETLITRSEGKPNGQAFVLLPKAEALKAQLDKHNLLGKRFIEVFSSTVADMETARRMCAEQQKASTSNSSDSSQRTMKQSTNKLHIIRLRGLPFSATPADIKSFLAPVELPDGISSIQMVRRPDLRPTGEAYVHLSTETDVMQALNKHKQMMGKRYIEVFPSCLAELQQSMTPPRPLGYPEQSVQQGQIAAAGVEIMPMLGATSLPPGGAVAQAAWLQQQMQLQALAQQKMAAKFQRQQQNLQMHAQMQAQAQALPELLQQMQLEDMRNSFQQQQQQSDTFAGMPGLSQQLLAFNGLKGSAGPMSPAVSMHSGSMTFTSPGAGHVVSGATPLSGNTSSMSGMNTSFGMLAGSTAGGLSQSAAAAAAAATATCSPSPLDVQYVPFFGSGNSGAMSALMLQEAQCLPTSCLQMYTPSCSYGYPASCGNVQQQSLFTAAEVLSSSANACDSTGMCGSLQVGLGGSVPAAYSSEPVLQGMSSDPLGGVPLRASTLGRADLASGGQDWLR